jgi:hypothetical protein
MPLANRQRDIGDTSVCLRVVTYVQPPWFILVGRSPNQPLIPIQAEDELALSPGGMYDGDSASKTVNLLGCSDHCHHD